MTSWLAPALMALLSFGLWGLFSKLALIHINSKSAFIFQTAGVILVGIITLMAMNFKLSMNNKGISFGFLTGLSYGIGCLFFLVAANKGKITTVVTLTALYPLVTLLLSYLFLHETLSLKQLGGIALALVAIFLMSD